METTELENKTVITEFILLGFGNLPGLQVPLFLLFLMIYIMTMFGNILIVVLIGTDRCLQTPMYFFRGNLSCLETCYISTILPKVLASFLTEDRTISVRGCLIQYYFFGILAGSECYLLTAMSYDRYLAVCKPLHHASIMNRRLCLWLTIGSYISGCLANTIVVFFMSQLTFCSYSEINHFFCDFPQLLTLACSNTLEMELAMSIICSLCTFPPSLLTVISYVYIITTIFKIPSTTGRQKAFSTCSSHLIMVTVFYGTLIIVYLLPKSNTMRDLNKVFSVFYTVLTPLLNPLIYSLRNKDVKESIRKAVRKCVDFVRTQKAFAIFF